MKLVLKLLKESLKITIFICVIFCMSLSIIYPFMHGMKDCPTWLPFVLYPVTIFTIAYIRIKNEH